jgi:Ulp1 family protease
VFLKSGILELLRNEGWLNDELLDAFLRGVLYQKIDPIATTGAVYTQ